MVVTVGYQSIFGWVIVKVFSYVNNTEIQTIIGLMNKHH